MKVVSANPYLDPAEVGHSIGPSWQDVEARLVEAARVLRDHRGEPSAWAGDAPWHLSRDGGTVADYWVERLGLLALGEAAPPPRMRPPVDRDAIARAEEAGAWLRFVAADGDRRLVCLAVGHLSRGGSQVPWRRLLGPMGLERGAEGLRKRYSRALTAICRALEVRTC